jgi:L-threonylcarbamoyladenylate synthase
MPDAGSPLRISASDPDAIDDAILAMRTGGIVGLPTETVYGIGVIPRPEALKALVEAKQRPEEKGIALLLDDLAQVEGLVAIPEPAQRLAARYWPGPLTLVLPLLDPGSVPVAVTGGRTTLGLRIPDHPLPRALAQALGPIAVTSANRSGEPPATTADELIASVGHSLALVIDDGPVRGGVASTVVAVDEAGNVRVLREGALSAAAVSVAAGQE